MTIGLRSLSHIFSQKYTPLLCLIFLALATLSSHSYWKIHQKKQSTEQGNAVRQYIESTLARDQKLSSEQLQSMLVNNDRIALLVVDDQLEKTQIGYINVKSFDQGATQLASLYNEQTTSEVLQRIAQNPQEFANPYLQIETQQIYRSMQNQKVKIGQMVIGYMLPGYHKSIPHVGGYYNLIYQGWMLFLLSNMMLYPMYLRRRLAVFRPAIKKEKDHLEWLEQELNIGSFEEDTTRDDVQKKPGWTELFNQNDFKDWNVKGQWYVKDQAAIGFPWGGSITTKYDIPFQKYEFEVEGQRMVGQEGFSILFQADGKQLIWVLGGWKNSRSEVIGYDQTKTQDKLDKFRWYYIKVECDDEKVVGFLDGRKIWEIAKKDLKDDTTDLGFQKGFGAAVWSSMARFQRVRIISTE